MNINVKTEKSIELSQKELEKLIKDAILSETEHEIEHINFHYEYSWSYNGFSIESAKLNGCRIKLKEN